MANQLNNLTDFANQTTTLQLPDGTTANLTLIFNATAERWVANIVYGTLVINGLGVCCLPNILRQWKNVIPFGLACATNDQTDPFAANDFSDGRARLFLLSADEVLLMESQIFGRAVA